MNDLTKLASGLGVFLKTAHSEKAAIDLLQHSDDKEAVVLYTAVQTLYGMPPLDWEPETLWLSLIRDKKIDLPAEARHKLQAAIALVVNPSFYWDNLVFQQTVQAFSGIVNNPEGLQEAHPIHMCWTVYEASILRSLDPDEPIIPDFDVDVQSYTAVCLQRAGFIYPPNQLLYAEEALTSLYPKESLELKDQVKAAWEAQPKEIEGLREQVFTEDPLPLQLHKLAGCYLYVHDTAVAVANTLLTLNV